MSARVFAPAKINLTLAVGPPRADGRHPLESAIAFADVGDWIEARESEALTLDVRGPFAPALAGETDNLVLRAARALARRIGAPERGAALVLEKKLPIASGIGGGSSDAAAALKALREAWRADVSDSDLIAIAAELGADVPVCVSAASAFMTGTGEQFAPLAIPAFDAVLVNPMTPLSTADVYRAFDRMGGGASFQARGAPAWRDAEEALAEIAAIGNDLEAPARALLPDLAVMAETLRAAPGVRYAALSGSGATMFALMQSAQHAAALAETMSARRSDWWVRACRLGA